MDMRNILPWCALIKGLYMLLMVIFLSEHFKWIIFVGSIVAHLVHCKFSWTFYVTMAVFFGAMEIAIVQYAMGHAWVYTHPDFLGIPLYLIPLWSIAAECIVDIFIWGKRFGLWSNQ